MFFLSRINIIIVITILLTYYGLHYYIYYSFVHFLNIKKKSHRYTILSFILFLASTFFFESFLPFNDFLSQNFLYLFGVWIATYFILIFSISILWILKGIYKITQSKFPFIYITYFLFISPFLITTYGLYESSTLKIREVTIPVKNLPTYWKDKTIVQISDLHLENIKQLKSLEEVTEKIEEISPEIVVITGDLFSYNSKNMQDLIIPLKKITSPILFTSGNHDRNFTDSKDDNLTLLDNKLFVKEGLQIIGLKYSNDKDKENPAEILKNEIIFDKEKPTILLYHTPTTIIGGEQGNRYISPNTDFTLVKESGIDLQLSGHTHGGQFFPLSIITHFIYKGYEKGLHKDGNFSLFVSTGLGTWGPPVRIFVPPEIVIIHLK